MELLLFGPVELRVDGATVYAGGPRQRSILAVLAANVGRPVPVDTLIDEVWDQEPPPKVRHAVHVYIARLRGLLRLDGAGSARLVHRGGGYLLDAEPDCIDIHRFQRLLDRARTPDGSDAWRVAVLGQALELWRGPALSDLSGQWAERVRQTWQRRYQDATAAWAGAHLRLGNPGAALARLGEVTREYPLVESLAAVYLRTLYADGRGSEALEHYDRLRRLLADKLGTDPGPELQQVHRQILTADPALASPAAATAAPPHRPSSTVPRQLPAPPQLFTGREEELASLTTVHDPTTVVVTAIDGMAGIGKTALAVRAAHRLAPHYPDGQLFIDLHGYTQDISPVNPAEALERILRSLGVAGGQVPGGLDERAALYRTRLAGHRMLILLDDAAAEDQVAPLLPGAPGCLVLVTSRRRLAGLDHTHSLSLDTLPSADAVTLFTRTVGGHRLAAEPPELIRETVQLCGRLPLAIRLAAARLRSHPAWRLADLVERLRGHQHRLAELAAGQRSITAALDLSYRHLTPDQQRAYRLLGLHPGTDIDTHAVAALAGAEPAVARRLLDRLHEAHLLQEAAPGRFAFHDLTRTHASQIAHATEPEPHRQAALTRLFDHYRRTVTIAAHSAYPYDRGDRPTPPASSDTPVVTDPSSATAWLDAELSNLLATAQHAGSHAWPAHTPQLSTALHRHLVTRGRFGDAEALHHRALAAAQRTGDRTGELTALNALGDVYRALGRHEQARHHYQPALQLARTTGNRVGETNALRGLGDIHLRQGRYEQARRHYQSALQLARTTGNRVGEINALNGLGDIHLRQDRYEQARHHYQPALQIARTTGHQTGLILALTGLADVQRRLGRYEQALAHDRQALEIARTIGHRVAEQNALHGLGIIYRLQGRYEPALDHYRVALEIARTTGLRNGELSALSGLGDVYRLQRHHRQAAEFYQQLLDRAREVGSRNWQFEGLHGLGRLQLATGHPETALTYHRKALDLAIELGQPADQARAYDGLANVQLALHQPESARRNWQQALDILIALGTERTEDNEATVPAIRARLASLSAQPGADRGQVGGGGLRGVGDRLL